VQTVLLVAAIVSSVLLPPEALLLGVVVGAIFMAATYVLSGGKATTDDYIAAFSLGFIVGTVIGGFYFGPEEAVLGAERASLPGAEKAGLSGAERAELATGERLAASEEPFALRAQMAADGGLREGSVAGRLDSANLPERVSAEFAGGRATPKVATGDETFVRYFDDKVSLPQGHWATSDSPVGSSWRARFKYRLSASGNRADFAEFVHLKAGTPFYEGRVAWRWSTQIYIEDPTA